MIFEDTFLHIFAPCKVFLWVVNIHLIRQGGDADAGIELDGRFFSRSFFRCDQHDSGCRFGTINGCRAGIFQYVDLGDIVRIDFIEASVVNNTVYHQ